MNSNLKNPILECSRPRWPFQRRSAARLPNVTMNLVAQPSRLRVRAASRRPEEHGAGRPVNSQAVTPALQPQSRFKGSTRELSLRGILALCLLGFLLPARGQDPWLTNLINPMDTNVSMGATVSFRVYANSVNLPMTNQWWHDGTALPGATNATLVITNVSVADAGGYVAWITNAIGGFTNTRTATLSVDPTFTKIMTGVIVTDAEGSLSGNWADYDGDGYVDLFVANSALTGSTRNTLYHNIGGTNFHNNAATNFVRVVASPFTTDFMRDWSAA